MVLFIIAGSILFLIVLLIIINLLSNYNILRAKYKNVSEELDDAKEKKETLIKEKDEVERKIDEKNFKFLAINQMAKTLAKEKNLNILKRLIMDMMMEVNSIKRGFALERSGEYLRLFETKNMDNDVSDIEISVNIDKELWEYLKLHKVTQVDVLKNYPKFAEIGNLFSDGYVMVFLVADEIGLEDIYFVIVLGEKTYGSYGEGEMEFLETLGGQVEIILENAIKNSYIEEQNKELTEKVYDLLTLNNAAKMISATLDVEEIFKSSIDMFTEVAQAVKGCILNYDRETEKMYVKAIRGDYKKELVGREVEISSEFYEKIRRDPGVKVLSNLRESELKDIVEFFKANHNFIKELKSELFIPLVASEELLGVILLGMRYSDEGYKDDNVEVYNTLANQIAISMYNAKLYNLAITDGMTKLFLHRYFQTRLEEELERSKRYIRKLSLLMIDIDHFKNFNDTYGHQTGDEVLKKVAKSIKENIRKSDVAARYGGEEFAVILPETDEVGAIRVGENLRKRVESMELGYNNERLKVTVSIGCFTFSPDETIDNIQKDVLVMKADKALYYSKETGRNRVSHYKEID